MKITVAIDSFKGSLSTFEAGNAAMGGIRRAIPDAEVTVCPLADGGEGTVDAIAGALDGQIIYTDVMGPRGGIIKSSYGYIPSTDTAVIEMARASGLTLIDESERDPMYTTTYGVGQLIKDAVGRGCRNFLIGIGGSATNDGGVGMLTALGFEFLDKQGCQIEQGCIGLRELAEIRDGNVLPDLKDCRFSVACDVTNPLCGKNGCTYVFAPQKGADPTLLEAMDGWMKGYAELTKNKYPSADSSLPGCGAAGGLGFAFTAYLGAELRSGIDIVINETGIEEHIKNSDFVVTGEGRLDGQSAMGKAPVGIARIAKKYGKPVIALSGCVADGAEATNKEGIDAFFPILGAPCSLDEAMDKENAIKNLSRTAEQAFRLADCIRNR